MKEAFKVNTGGRLNVMQGLLSDDPNSLEVMPNVAENRPVEQIHTVRSSTNKVFKLVYLDDGLRSEHQQFQIYSSGSERRNRIKHTPYEQLRCFPIDVI